MRVNGLYGHVRHNDVRSLALFAGFLGKTAFELATGRGYDTFVATMLPDNRAALGLVHKLVPDATVRWAGGEYEASLPLAHAS